MRAVRDSETAAESHRPQPGRVKTVAFALSAVLRGPRRRAVRAAARVRHAVDLPVLAVDPVRAGRDRSAAPDGRRPAGRARDLWCLPELLCRPRRVPAAVLRRLLLLLVLWIAPDGVVGTLARRFRSRPTRVADSTSVRYRARFSAPVGGSDAWHRRPDHRVRRRAGRASDVGFAAPPGRITEPDRPERRGQDDGAQHARRLLPAGGGTIRLGEQRSGGMCRHRDRARRHRAHLPDLAALRQPHRDRQRGPRHARGPARQPRSTAGLAARDRRRRGLLAFVGYRGAIDVRCGRSAARRPAPGGDRARARDAACVLLLDEPAAGLSRGDKAHLKSVLRRIADAGIAVVLVEHDMALVMGISRPRRGARCRPAIATGAPAAIGDDPSVRTAYLGAGNAGAAAVRAGCTRRAGTFCARARPGGLRRACRCSAG